MTDAVGRRASRIGSEYFLRTLTLATNIFGGDLVGALILMAVMQANVAHLDPFTPGVHETEYDGPPPDSERRPISVSALAAGIGLPYETVRRRVAAFEAEGWLVRSAKGVIVPAARLTGPAHTEVMAENLRNMRRLARRMMLAGLYP